MLRGFVIGFGVLLLGGGCIGVHAGLGFAMTGPIILGALFLIGTIFERKPYRPAECQKPGIGWEATGEKFQDPDARGQLVEVWYNKTTGERRYVRS